MKNIKILAAAALLGVGAFMLSSFIGGDKKEPIAAPFASNGQNLSYAFGMLIGTDLKTRGLSAKDINAEELANGLKAAMGEGAPEMDMQAAQALVQQEFAKIQQASQSKSTDEGKKFLETNAKRKEVKTTASGLQYEVLKDASGAKPSLQDKVKVHYHGTLPNGTVFDSSVERGEPISFPLNGVIPGWQEGLQLMPVGSKYKFYIPASLGYGDRPAGKIPANSVLVFEVELLGIN